MNRPPPTPLEPGKPAPWHFYTMRWGFRDVVTDRDGCSIVSNVAAACGPLLAAGPQLLHVLEQIAAIAVKGSAIQELALNAVESFREREGFTSVDWRPFKPAPRLRIVGNAS